MTDSNLLNIRRAVTAEKYPTDPVNADRGGGGVHVFYNMGIAGETRAMVQARGSSRDNGRGSGRLCNDRRSRI